MLKTNSPFKNPPISLANLPRSFKKHKTTDDFGDSPLVISRNANKSLLSEENPPHSSYSYKKSDSHNKKTVSFHPNPQRNNIRNNTVSFQNPSKVDEIIENSENIEKIKNIVNFERKTVEIRKEKNLLNYNISKFEKNELENDIDTENLKKFTERFPSQRLNFLRNGESEFYKIFTIKEESDDENEEKKRKSLNKKKSELVITKEKLPKFSGKFLVDEFFGEKDDSLDSDSENSNSLSEEEIKDIIKKPKKKRFDEEIKTNHQEKNKLIYNYLQDFLHPTLNLQDDINENIEENSKLKKEITAIPHLFRQHTKLITKRKPDFLKVTMMDPIERIHLDFDVFPDEYPLKKVRKVTLLWFRYFFYKKSNEFSIKSNEFSLKSNFL